MNTNKKINLLQANEEDYEFYPTTEEILSCIQKDIINTCNHEDYRYYSFGGSDGISCSRNYDANTDVVKINTFLDIGAGDGRVLNFFQGANKVEIKIENKLGIEIARAQGDDLIRNKVGLIGRDYFETVLIDKFYNIVFSNPPYSIYQDWCKKLLKEVNSIFIYLVIPQRWQNDLTLKEMMEKKGDVTILGSFDFAEGDRPARAKVDVIKIECSRRANTDTFTEWVEENIGEFVENEKVERDTTYSTLDNDLQARNEDTTSVLIENYKKDLADLVATYQTLGKLDFRLLRQLGVSKTELVAKIKSDIDALKNKYWLTMFNTMDCIRSRLTYKTRKALMEKISWFKQLDFNTNNVYTIMIWVIENFNLYTKEQMLALYDVLTDFSAVRTYKSNDKWIKDGWRYNKEVPEKYALDYRIVSGVSINKYYQDDNGIADFAIVATSLGFPNKGINSYEPTVKHECVGDDGKVLFEYRIYKNGNVHFKVNKELLKALNIEVGKLKGWLKEPTDIATEFDIPMEEATSWFSAGELQLLGKESKLLLGFKA